VCVLIDFAAATRTRRSSLSRFVSPRAPSTGCCTSPRVESQSLTLPLSVGVIRSQAHPEGVGNRSKLSEYAKATLGSGNMRSAVVLPKGEELNEWLAVNSQ